MEQEPQQIEPQNQESQQTESQQTESQPCQTTTSLFPDDFNLDATEKKINEKICTSDDLKKAVEYIQKCRDTSVENNLEYFILDLKNYNPLVRKSVMTQLLERFKYVGKPVDDIIFNVVSIVMNNQNQKTSNVYDRPIVRVSYISPADTEYIVATTKNFGESMTTYVMKTPVKK